MRSLIKKDVFDVDQMSSNAALTVSVPGCRDSDVGGGPVIIHGALQSEIKTDDDRNAIIVIPDYSQITL